MKLIKITNDDNYTDKFTERLIIVCIIPMVIVFILLCIAFIYYTTKIPIPQPPSYDTSSKFTRIESSAIKNSYDIVYDNETKVMYAVSYNGDFTVLLNADGTPLLYKGE